MAEAGSAMEMVPRGSSVSAASVMSRPLVHGISYWMAGVFITGEIAGSGMLALPYSVAQTGWVGVPLIFVLGVVSAYCGLCLSRSWLIIESRYPELHGRCAEPYPEIAFHAAGKPGKVLAAVCMSINTFGACIVYVLIVAQLLENLLCPSPSDCAVDLSYCIWVLVIAAILVPVSWLGSPKDFWWIGILALGTTSLAWLFCMIQLSSNFAELSADATFHSPEFLPFFLGVGPILFSFGGASTFPTIQNDMQHRDMFGRSVILGFIGLITMYLPIAAVGYFAVGDDVASSILDTLKDKTPGPLSNGAEILFIIHLVTAFSVVINPFLQQMEVVAKVPPAFGIRRCLFRTLLMGVLVLLGELIPDFVKILDLLGSTTIALMTFILPPFFYLRLCAMEDPDGKWKTIPIPLWERVLLYELIVVGFAGGIASAISSVQSIIDEGLETSCLIG
ncbi:amino acid transporter AVT3B-like [Amphibalanus amphitrite]|uniref:amino acid transporter AVT3B-like n=1 Tax=Amphibalanus amphitrite TaxID=1232801 RepID=UPI001C8FAA98|nr:amino acid transporter AVT3B-like [Amphibalanus amphitrite]